MAEAAERHWWYRSTRTLLEEMIGPMLPATGVYLDAAGGTGATGRWLADRGTTVIADLEPAALAVTSSVSSGYRPERADLDRLPHPDDTFDAVLCVTALYHRLVADPAATVKELARVARPGGLVCLMEPGVRRLRRPHDAVTHAARRFSRRDLTELVEKSELELLRSTGAYTFLVPPAALSAMVSKGEASSDIDQHESGFFGALGAVARLERRWLRHRNLPFGLSVLAIARKPMLPPTSPVGFR